MDARRFCRSDEALSRKVGPAVYLARPKSAAIDVLNDTAAAVWGVLEAEPTLDELTETLATRYGRARSSIQPEVRTLIEQLVRLGWVRVEP